MFLLCWVPYVLILVQNLLVIYNFVFFYRSVDKRFFFEVFSKYGCGVEYHGIFCVCQCAMILVNILMFVIRLNYYLK